MIPPGQVVLVLIYTAELTGASQVMCPSQGHTTQLSDRGFELTTFGLRAGQGNHSTKYI